MANLNWQFPRGIGGNTSQPYMILTSYKSLNAIASAPNPMSSIALYIPPNSLKQTTDANWSGVEGGALKAGAMGALENITGLRKLGKGGEGEVTDWAETIGNIFTSAGMGMFQAGAKQFDKGTGMLSAGTGIAVNNHMAMAYKGPDKFRTHEFAFNFFPKNKDDAKEIKEIIYDFQNGMLPRMMGKSLKANRKLSKPFFQSPRHWNIEFYNGDGTKNQVTETIEGKTEKAPGFLFEIKKSVITSMTVNHDPNSTISLHADGSPVQTAFSLTFQEIELPISEDKPSGFPPTGMSPGNPFRQDQRTGSQAGDFSNMTEAQILEWQQTRSDFRLKDNITLLQEEGFGIPNIYSFNYKWDAETTWIGVMAQELLDTGYSDAVGTDSEGFYFVDYSRLGFPMIGFK